MGSLSSRFSSYSNSNENIRVLMIGLDGAGKTTILDKIKTGDFVSTTPTIGWIQRANVIHRNVHFTVWELGSQPAIRPMWRLCFDNTKALIFVVDCNDDELRDVPLLVFANKSDLLEESDTSDMTCKLGLPKIKNRKWHVQSSCALTGEGVQEGLEWLFQNLFLMDCVPYKFCEDVFCSLDMLKCKLEDAAKELTGLWKIAAEKCAENLCTLKVTLWKDIQGKWQCTFERRWEMPEDMKLPKSIGELLAMDRRFTRIGAVVFVGDAYQPINEAVITISNKELVEKLISFLNAQSLFSCVHHYMLQGSPESRDEDLEVFLRYDNIVGLFITYYGQHSEDYLVAQIKNSSRLDYLEINEAVHWPHSEKVEDVFIEFLRKPMKIHLFVYTYPGSLMVTIRTVKDVFKQWCKTGKLSELKANSDVTEEELLPLTVPEGVTRHMKRANDDYESMFIIQWRRGTTFTPMDSVPFIFCVDVLERLSRGNLFTMADHLSGQWRSAAQRFAELKRYLFVTISKDSEGWWYGVEDEKIWENTENAPRSHEEFLSMDRRYSMGLEYKGGITVEGLITSNMKVLIIASLFVVAVFAQSESSPDASPPPPPEGFSPPPGCPPFRHHRHHPRGSPPPRNFEGSPPPHGPHRGFPAPPPGCTPPPHSSESVEVTQSP
ncbi:hypothetical protein QR680_010708 [Steinernema hermaphroditum]|uniref:ADP-ribosylation factor 1-like 2 n=1 Tax=Steinernema hermaphroditum TaxID=289476 RepID=A0AA39IRP0_9BILA|nr:hypothetical protein QR680_010708 [Steinernema hermaphroditum]